VLDVDTGHVEIDNYLVSDHHQQHAAACGSGGSTQR
jgi:hypothetical protein